MSGIIPDDEHNWRTTETAGPPPVRLEDIYQIMAANYIMQQRIYDVMISILQLKDPEDAKRVHDLHIQNQTLSPDIRLG